jgi:hypothetical protein
MCLLVHDPAFVVPLAWAVPSSLCFGVEKDTFNLALSHQEIQRKDK